MENFFFKERKEILFYREAGCFRMEKWRGEGQRSLRKKESCRRFTEKES